MSLLFSLPFGNPIQAFMHADPFAQGAAIVTALLFVALILGRNRIAAVEDDAAGGRLFSVGLIALTALGLAAAIVAAVFAQKQV